MTLQLASSENGSAYENRFSVFAQYFLQVWVIFVKKKLSKSSDFSVSF